MYALFNAISLGVQHTAMQGYAQSLPVSSVNFPTIDVLGVYPTLQTLGLQALLVIAAVVFVFMSRSKTAGSG